MYLCEQIFGRINLPKWLILRDYFLNLYIGVIVCHVDLKILSAKLNIWNRAKEQFIQVALWIIKRRKYGVVWGLSKLPPLNIWSWLRFYFNNVYEMITISFFLQNYAIPFDIALYIFSVKLVWQSGAWNWFCWIFQNKQIDSI